MIFTITVRSPNAPTYSGIIVARDLDHAYVLGYGQVAPRVSRALPVVLCVEQGRPIHWDNIDRAVHAAREFANSVCPANRWEQYLEKLETGLRRDNLYPTR